VPLRYLAVIILPDWFCIREPGSGLPHLIVSVGARRPSLQRATPCLAFVRGDPTEAVHAPDQADALRWGAA